MTQKQLLCVGMPTALHKLTISNAITDCDFATPSTHVCNLNVIFDPQLLFDAHIEMAEVSSNEVQILRYIT